MTSQFNIYVDGFFAGATYSNNRKNAKKTAKLIYGKGITAVYPVKNNPAWDYEAYEHRPKLRGGKILLANY